MILTKKWRVKRRDKYRQKICFHHELLDPSNKQLAISYIKSELIDSGKRKHFWCIKCDKNWWV